MFMLRRNLVRAILKLPRWIGEDRAEAITARGGEEVDRGGIKTHAAYLNPIPRV